MRRNFSKVQSLCKDQNTNQCLLKLHRQSCKGSTHWKMKKQKSILMKNAEEIFNSCLCINLSSKDLQILQIPVRTQYTEVATQLSFLKTFLSCSFQQQKLRKTGHLLSKPPLQLEESYDYFLPVGNTRTPSGRYIRKNFPL